jgi:hypothetical protein
VSDESAASLNELRMSRAFPPQMTVGIATDELRSNCFSSLVEAWWIEVQNEPGGSVRQRFSDARWAYRVAFACRNARDRLDALICTLADIADRALEANYLLSMIDSKFVLILHLFCDLLGKVHGVSIMLQ